MIKYSLILNLIFIPIMNCIAQNKGMSNLWYMGYSSWGGSPFGHTKIDFYAGSPSIVFDSLKMDISRTNTNISDTSGNMLFYTNGYYIADASNDTMQNGSDISPTIYSSLSPFGLVVPQACLIIPKPGSNTLYYMFHSTLDNAPDYNKAHYLYYSIIDMTLNNGKGAVTSKNVVILTDTLNAGKITACKHGNGRDWWVVCHRFNSNDYYKFLVTPSGISPPIIQSIGSIRTIIDIGQVSFSPDGNKFAYFNAYYTTAATLDIYHFDRCTGNFYNPHSIIIPQSTGIGGGLAFSPNSKYLYVSNIDSVYQFDVTNVNIGASKITVAAWDSFYSPSPPFATLFDLTHLAPNGKIYIGTGNSTLRMHVINNPDSFGLACDLIQHSIIIPGYYVGGVPNHPNYFLGRDTASICDSLTGISSTKHSEINFKVLPNPSTGKFALKFDVQNKPGFVEIFNINGQIIFKDIIAQWSQYKQIDIINEPSGVYLCRVRWGEQIVNIKLLKQ